MIRLPGWRHLLVQLVASVFAWLLFAPLSQPGQWLAVQVLVAVLLAGYMKFSLPRRLIHLLFMPLVALAGWLALPVWLYPVGFVVLYALSRNALTESVPLYLSSAESIEALAEWLPPNARVLDLGSGDGRVVLRLAALRPDLQLCGVENAVLPWLYSRLKHRFAGAPENVRICYGNFWAQDWQQFDVIHAFLSPAPMARVWVHFRQHAHPGAQLVSNSFGIDGVEPIGRVPLTGLLQKELLIWRQNHGHC